MAKITNIVGRGKAKAEYNAFKAVRGILQTRLEALTPTQRQQALDILNNWGTATQAQKVEALMASVALIYVVVGYLVYERFKDA